MSELLRVENVTGGYTKRLVVKDVSCAVNKGELVGLIGLNGAGKSTTIKHIIGLMEPKKGTVTINGKPMRDDMTAYRARFSFIPETTVLYDELTLAELLKLPARA